MAKNDKKKYMNGSVDILAKAMKAVFQEGMDATREAVKGDIDGLRTDIKQDMDSMEERLKDNTKQQIDTTNENMQAQFAEQEKKISGIGSKVDQQGKQIAKLVGKKPATSKRPAP